MVAPGVAWRRIWCAVYNVSPLTRSSAAFDPLPASVKDPSTQCAHSQIIGRTVTAVAVIGRRRRHNIASAAALTAVIHRGMLPASFSRDAWRNGGTRLWVIGQAPPKHGNPLSIQPVGAGIDRRAHISQQDPAFDPLTLPLRLVLEDARGRLVLVPRHPAPAEQDKARLIVEAARAMHATFWGRVLNGSILPRPTPASRASRAAAEDVWRVESPTSPTSLREGPIHRRNYPSRARWRRAN